MLKNTIGSWWKSWSKKSKSANRKELGNIQDQDVQVIWQMRKLYFEDYKNTIRMLFRLFLLSKEWTLYMQLQILLFLEQGVISVKLCIVGKPVFFPSPNVLIIKLKRKSYC
jgi:hypothetical protein